jgi:Tfp pilus assembly protein PilO
MSKISKTKKQQMVLVLLGAAAVIAGLWYVVVQNQNARLESVQKKTDEMRDKVAKAENLLKKADQIAENLETSTKSLETIENGMASGDIYLWVINTINQFNSTRQLTFLDFQREIMGDVGALPKFPYKAATFPVKGTGYYHNIGKFIADFENDFPYVRVQNLELSPATKGNGAGEDPEKLSFKFEIVTLIKPTNS